MYYIIFRIWETIQINNTCTHLINYSLEGIPISMTQCKAETPSENVIIIGGSWLSGPSATATDTDTDTGRADTDTLNTTFVCQPQCKIYWLRSVAHWTQNANCCCHCCRSVGRSVIRTSHPDVHVCPNECISVYPYAQVLCICKIQDCK